MSGQKLPTSRFNIRVYGIWIHQDNLLVSDERIGNFCFTKFPGGGLEYGEGLIDGLIREWQEELHTNIEVLEHFYTTDFFQESAFHPNTQIISIYYKVRPLNEPKIPIHAHPQKYLFLGHEECYFRWIPLAQLSSTHMTLPIDKIVADKLVNH